MGAVDTQREEGLADVISIHSLVVALGITNIWQPLIIYTLVYTCGHNALGSSMLRDGDCDCCVHCEWTCYPKNTITCYGKQVAKQLTCIDNSLALLGNIGQRDRSIALLLSAGPVKPTYTQMAAN